MVRGGTWSRRTVSALLFANVLAAVSFLWIGDASAAVSGTVVPNTGINNGDKVTVSGSGFTPGFGALTLCNNDPGQPTVLVALANVQVPVGCTNPVNVLVTIDGAGKVPATQFTVTTGTVGPPDPGTDSIGNPAATDAAKYPCPPTAAQINAGVMCVIGIGDLSGNRATVPITYAGQAAPTTTTTTPPTTAASTTTTAKPATTTTVAQGATTTTVVTSTTVVGTAATTSTTLAASVLGTQTTRPSASGSSLPRTGLPRHLVLMAVIGVAVLDLGYLFESSTRPARRLRERLRQVVRR